MEKQPKILWIDDEVELLEPHLLFLQEKGYEITPASGVPQALELMETEQYSLALLDESMPGITGIEAIPMLKESDEALKIVMVTKNEEEHLMEEAIGKEISDYLLKPVHPSQVLLSLKKSLSSKDLIEKQTILSYQQEFRKLSMELMDIRSFEDWANHYKKLLSWELRLDKVEDTEFSDLLSSQKEEANILFGKFIEKNYPSWMTSKEKPVMSHTLFQQCIKPTLEKDKVLLLVVDNLRYDQWKTIEPLFTKYYQKESEDPYLSILPTTTQYARNALFSGLLPLEIQRRFPEKWVNDHEEGNKNEFEEEFLLDQMQRLGLRDKTISYIKILNADFERKILEDFSRYQNSDLLTIVYNFIDILSHAKTDNSIVDQLIRDDQTFRSLSYNWFENSSVIKLLKKAAEAGYKLIVTTDHGMVQVKKPHKIIGDRESSTNIRYKTGKSLSYGSGPVWSVNDPESIFLPKGHLSSTYVFAKNSAFLAYPKNYNHFVSYYKDTYQHGGISLEECIVPFVIMQPR